MSFVGIGSITYWVLVLKFADLIASLYLSENLETDFGVALRPE